MFKIAKTNAAAPLMRGSLELNDNHPEMLAQFSVSESWVGDFSSGVIRLKERSAKLHGLTLPECGLLSLMRCYDPNDRNRIVQIFEQAATLSSSFCFSTTIIMQNGYRQPLFCMGESNGYEHDGAGSMLGMFIFPRVETNAGKEVFRRQ
ncbi:hypothetical protein [Rhizobium sp. 18055]|uniref:hypothetical protein n=1 Tax=Rhizobium sp. 18055 TaxID=2681403 RepID=UPI00190F607A|nr:hypothetical protein [Rhizobium sp. 18055]